MKSSSLKSHCRWPWVSSVRVLLQRPESTCALPSSFLSSASWGLGPKAPCSAEPHASRRRVLPSAQVGELLSAPGFPEAVVQILATSADPGAEGGGWAPGPGSELLTEVCWVLAYTTAGAEAHLNCMVNLGVVPPLVAHLRNTVQLVCPSPPLCLRSRFCARACGRLHRRDSQT